MCLKATLNNKSNWVWCFVRCCKTSQKSVKLVFFRLLCSSKENNGSFDQEYDKWVAPEKDSPTKRNTNKEKIISSFGQTSMKKRKSDRNIHIFLWFIPITQNDVRQRKTVEILKHPEFSGRKSNVNEPETYTCHSATFERKSDRLREQLNRNCRF